MSEKYIKAKEYIDKGLSVIPVGKNKKPIIAWKEFTQRYATDEELKEWFIHNDYNIGIVTGKISGITVVDIDGKIDVDLPDTLEAKTPKGKHKYYNYEPDIGNGVRVLNNIDIRNDSGYVVAPPSVINDKQYEWINSDEFDRSKVVDFPKDLFENKNKLKSNGKSEITKKDFSIVISKGSRNEDLTTFVGTLLCKHPEKDWEGFCLPIIQSYNKTNCTPPLSEKDVETIFESICKRERRKRDMKTEELKDMNNINQDPENKNRIAKVPKPEKEISFIEWQKVIRKNFPDLLFHAEVASSMLAQILVKDITNPFALAFIGPPSSGKTIAINFFDDISELTCSTDKFTPASFVSHATNVKKEVLSTIDLLPRIRNKMMLVRDFAPLFGERDDDLLKSLGLLTRALDGEGLQTDSGVHGHRGYSGEYIFMLLGASPPIRPRVWKLMGTLGSRLLFLNMPSKNKSESELMEQLTDLAYKEKEKECRLVTKNFLHTLWDKYANGIIWNKKADDLKCLKAIVNCAKLLAKLRGVIELQKENINGEGDKDNREYKDDPEEYRHKKIYIEEPDRINQLLYNLARGHAVISGRNQIDEEDLKPVIEIVIDSAPQNRGKLFRALLENNGKMKSIEVEAVLRCSRPTAHREMETLRLLGITSVSDPKGNESQLIKLNKEFEWFLSDECKEIRKINEVLTVSDSINRIYDSEILSNGKLTSNNNGVKVDDFEEEVISTDTYHKWKEEKV